MTQRSRTVMVCGKGWLLFIGPYKILEMMKIISLNSTFSVPKSQPR
jgi:hypothetical protein